MRQARSDELVAADVAERAGRRQHERRRIEPLFDPPKHGIRPARGRAPSSADPGRCPGRATAPTAIANDSLCRNGVSGLPLRMRTIPDSRHPLTDAVGRTRERVGARQIPDEVQRPVVLGVEIGEALVVVRNELGHRRRRGGGRVGEERRVLGRVLGPRPRVRRLHLQAVAPALAQIDDQRAVPGVAVAGLHLDRRKAAYWAAGPPPDRTTCRPLRVVGVGMFRSELRHRCWPRDPAYANRHAPSPTRTPAAR